MKKASGRPLERPDALGFWESMPASKHLTGLEAVSRAAIRAFGVAGLGHIQVDLGVAVPQLHIGLGAGAEHTTLGIQVFGGQFDDGVRGHFSCLSCFQK